MGRHDDMGVETGPGPAIQNGGQARAVRELAGRSRAEVARATGLTRRELSAIEHGRRPLSADEARALAGALGIEPDAFTGADTTTPPEDEATRIDATIAHDPAAWDAVPASVADLPPALPVVLPDSERRHDHATRAEVERSWESVRRDMDEVLAVCTKVATAGSGADLRALLRELETSVEELNRRRSFQRQLTRHDARLATARRGEGATASVSQRP